MFHWHRPRTFMLIGGALLLLGGATFWRANHVSLPWGFAGAVVFLIGSFTLFFGVDLWFRQSGMPSLIGLDDD